jgi:hypothetical protein
VGSPTFKVAWLDADEFVRNLQSSKHPKVRQHSKTPAFVNMLARVNQIKDDMDLLENETAKQVKPKSPYNVDRQHQLIVSYNLSSTDHVGNVIFTLVMLAHN